MLHLGIDPRLGIKLSVSGGGSLRLDSRFRQLQSASRSHRGLDDGEAENQFAVWRGPNKRAGAEDSAA